MVNWLSFFGLRASPNWDVEAFLSISCGMAAVFGHMFPVLLTLRWKGAATPAECFWYRAYFHWHFVCTFGLIVWITRYVSLASIVSTAIYPITLLIMRYGLDGM